MSKEKFIIPLPEDNLDIIDFVDAIFPFDAISRLGISKAALKRAIENENIEYDEINDCYLKRKTEKTEDHLELSFKVIKTRDGYKLEWLHYKNKLYCFPTCNSAKYNVIIA